MATGSGSYERQIQKWRDEFAAELTGPEGPFTVVARLIPKQGVSTVGSDKSCDLVVTLPKVPGTIGRLEFDGKRATLGLVSTVHATVDKHPVTTVEISNEKPTEVAINGFKLRFGFRDGVLRMTIVDPDSPMRGKAAPVKWFPVQDKYRITANWVAYPKPKLVHLADSDGSGRDWQCPGYAAFRLEGHDLTLRPTAFPGDSELFFAFGDMTNGHETYGGGRFFDADAPKAGKLILDFNKAYNPTCVYNHLYYCPVPSKENRLPIKVRAGALNYID